MPEQANQEGHPERRRFTRISVDFDILYRVDAPPEVRMKTEEGEKSAAMLNISEGGLAFVTDCLIPEYTQIEIQFHLIFKEKQTPPITATGKVRYCVELADRERMYRVGIEFTKIDEEDRKVIVDFVKSMSNSWFYRFLKK